MILSEWHDAKDIRQKICAHMTVFQIKKGD